MKMRLVQKPRSFIRVLKKLPNLARTLKRPKKNSSLLPKRNSKQRKPPVIQDRLL
jgi:hypothetical protein